MAGRLGGGEILSPPCGDRARDQRIGISGHGRGAGASSDRLGDQPAISWGVVVAVGLLLAGVPMLLFNQQHSGDPLKIRRELRMF